MNDFDDDGWNPRIDLAAEMISAICAGLHPAAAAAALGMVISHLIYEYGKNDAMETLFAEIRNDVQLRRAERGTLQ
jgi:hypothetical protein